MLLVVLLGAHQKLSLVFRSTTTTVIAAIRLRMRRFQFSFLLMEFFSSVEEEIGGRLHATSCVLPLSNMFNFKFS